MTIETLAPDVLVDNEALMDHLVKGKPLDPDVARRIHERAAEIKEQIRRTQGVQNIAVDLVRQSRDEE